MATDPKTLTAKALEWAAYLRKVGQGKVKPGVQNQPKPVK